MDKPETQVIPDPFVGNLVCFPKNLCFFKTCVFESKHQAPKRRTKKDKELNKKREEIKKEIKKSSKNRDIKNMYIFKLFETNRMIVFGEKRKS